MRPQPVLIARQLEARDIYPFRRVFRTATLEAFLMLVITGLTLLALRFLPLPSGPTIQRGFGVGFSLVPLALWYVFSYRAERRALQPRGRLFGALLMGGLVASGIGIPITERVFAVEEWLTNVEGLSRIIGYMLTSGMIYTFAQYAVLRYTIWPDAFSNRMDGVAYAMTTAVGFATILNLNFALVGTTSLSASALRIAEQSLAQVAISTVLGFCLAELRRPDVSVIILPIGFVLSAALQGLAIVFRAGLIVAGISPSATGNNATYGLGMAVFLVTVMFFSVRFLIRNADERDALRQQRE